MNTFVKKLAVVVVVLVVSAAAAAPADACWRWFSRGSSPSSARVATSMDGTVRRSFSYEPSYRGDRSSSAPKKAPWQYPKSDPRRYRP
jgi:hypothetical protein